MTSQGSTWRASTVVRWRVPVFSNLPAAADNVDEFAGGKEIVVRRKGGTTGTSSVSYATVGGTATVGLDYTNAAGTADLPAR